MLDVTQRVLKAIIVRSLMVCHSVLTVWRAADVKQNNIYWLLGLANVFLFIEGAYTIIRRKGEETKWVSLCFLIYLFCTLPAIWFLELDKLADYDNIVSQTNISNIQKETLSSISGVQVPIQLEANTWITVLEESLLFLLIIGRWLLPRGKLTRNQLSQLLFVYISIASDCMELFVLFEEEKVRKNRTVTYATLIIWSLSLTQFTIALTATKMARKRVACVNIEDGSTEKRHGRCERLFRTEMWSLMISIVLMDGPYLSIRLYCVFVLNILSYGILFFSFKNVLMICLLIYRMVIVCINEIEGREEDEEESDEETEQSTSESNNKISPAIGKD